MDLPPYIATKIMTFPTGDRSSHNCCMREGTTLQSQALVVWVARFELHVVLTFTKIIIFYSSKTNEITCMSKNMKLNLATNGDVNKASQQHATSNGNPQ